MTQCLHVGESGRTTITTTVTIAIVIGGVTTIVLITLMIVIITVTCRFAVCSRKKENNQGNRNAPYELTSNIAYHNWNDEASGDNSSPTAVYDYIDGSAPAGPRGQQSQSTDTP